MWQYLFIAIVCVKFSFDVGLKKKWFFFKGLLQAEDIEEVFEIIHRELDLSMNRVVVLIKDYEMQDQVKWRHLKTTPENTKFKLFVLFDIYMKYKMKTYHTVIITEVVLLLINYLQCQRQRVFCLSWHVLFVLGTTHKNIIQTKGGQNWASKLSQKVA